MKKTIKIILLSFLGILLLFIVDLMWVYIFNRPLLAVKSKCKGCYSGILYDTYKCDKDSKIKIKSKSSNFECPLINDKIKTIIDDTVVCDTALEKFYEDTECVYYFGCNKSEYISVIYTNGEKENVKDALKNNNILINDLDRFNIKYIKKIKTDNWDEITKDGVNEEKLLNNLNEEELKIIAEKLQGLTIKIGEKEKADPEYVLKAGWLKDYPVSEEFNYVINMGPKVMKELYFIIYKSKSQGLYEYLCATALEKISGEEYEMWSSSKEFLELFNKMILESR